MALLSAVGHGHAAESEVTFLELDGVAADLDHSQVGEQLVRRGKVCWVSRSSGHSRIRRPSASRRRPRRRPEPRPGHRATCGAGRPLASPLHEATRSPPAVPPPAAPTARSPPAPQPAHPSATYQDPPPAPRQPQPPRITADIRANPKSRTPADVSFTPETRHVNNPTITRLPTTCALPP